MHIGTDALLFIDDNVGEVADVAARVAGISCIHAAENAQETWHRVAWHPGLFRPEATEEDGLRVNDMQMAKQRDQLKQAAQNPEGSLKSLRIHLQFFLNPEAHSQRLSELSQKTNQFNTNFRRFTEADVLERIRSPQHVVVGVRLSDRLSDSGIVATIFGRFADEKLVFEEICISCRALGRQLEDLFITAGVSGMLNQSDRIQTLVFPFQEGPRNQPAKGWLRNYCGKTDKRNIEMYYKPWHPERAEEAIRRFPVTISWG